MVPPQSFLPDFPSRPGVQAAGDTTFVGHQEHQPIDDYRRRDVWSTTGCAPGNVAGRDIPSTIRSHGQ